MSLHVPNPSSRLLRAAAAERADLSRHRKQLTHTRDKLLAELGQLDDAIAAVDQRLAMLGQLAGPPRSADTRGDVVELTAPAPAPPDALAPGAPRPDTPAPGLPGPDTPAPAVAGASRQLLRGPRIREMAVKTLVHQPAQIEALHYRQWYELVRKAGYSVAGKDPLAVFLTQLNRSPVVRKTTKPGVYEVDRRAPPRIRQRLERLQGELRDAIVAPQAPIELADVRARRHELDLAISQEERALEEALRVLGHDDSANPALGATTAG